MIHARRLVWNTALSFALNVTLRAAGALTFIAIGRLSSVRDAGTFSLALGYLAILTTLFVGLDDILVRESARAPGQTPPLLATYGALRVALSITAWLALVLALATASLYSPRDLATLAVISACILIDCFSALAQSVLNARGRFGSPLAATFVGSVVRLGGALWVLLEHGDLFTLAFAWPLGSVFTASILSGVLVRALRRCDNQIEFRFDPGLARDLLSLFPVFGATAILAGLEYQLDVILISVMLSNEAVAQYSAAVTIMTMLQMIPQSYRIVLYPIMARSLRAEATATRQLMRRSLWMLMGMAIPSAIAITVLAAELTNLIYGSRFTSTASILQVLIWNIIFLFLNVPLVRYLMATDGQEAVWRTLTFSLIVNVAANLIFIQQLGTIGAAYARLCSSGSFCLLIGWQVFRRLRTDSLI